MDKEIKCGDCGENFTFTERDQEFYASKGFSDPKRCPDCRRARKTQSGGGGGNYDRGERETYEITCDDCGKPATVPFKPRGDGPLYCRDCFRDRKR